MTHPLTVERDWFSNNLERRAVTYRPQGTPGVYRGHLSTILDVLLDRDGLLWHHVQTGRGNTWAWVPMRGWDVARFEADDVPEWVAECPHDRVCDSEAECGQLMRAEGDR